MMGVGTLEKVAAKMKLVVGSYDKTIKIQTWKGC